MKTSGKSRKVKLYNIFGRIWWNFVCWRTC